MAIENKKSKYSKTANFFHWGFVVLFLYGIFKQVDNIDQLQNISFLKFEIIFALIFLILLIIRFIYMKLTQKSSLPPETSKLQKNAAKFVHNSMYFLLLGTVLSGLFIGVLFWIGHSNSIVVHIAISFHEIIINILYIFIIIHILAAFYHRLRNDGVWDSMFPYEKKNKY